MNGCPAYAAMQGGHLLVTGIIHFSCLGFFKPPWFLQIVWLYSCVILAKIFNYIGVTNNKKQILLNTQ